MKQKAGFIAGFLFCFSYAKIFAILGGDIHYMPMASIIKKYIPRTMVCCYHYCIAIAANWFYKKPSEKMVVIGVTGTNGKTTTVRMIADILTACGKEAGLISTAEFQVGDARRLNDMKMTMPGRFALQKLLHGMVVAGCEYAVIETSSQGVEQFRHVGINYDAAVFTNLTPEHIEAHGGFENYRKAKGKFFRHLTRMKKKNIKGKIIEKISIVNLDDEYASYFMQFGADKKFGYTLKTRYDISGVEEVRAENIRISENGSSFQALGQNFNLAILGEHNVYNAMAALALGHAFGLGAKAMADGLRDSHVPGRLEFIREGQNFTVIIDYAPEPESLKKLYATVKIISKQNIIHILGSCGGGRDSARRPVLGEIAGKNARYVIVTNEDPYDDDPHTIIDQVGEGAKKAGKIENQNLFKILDRRMAIRKAFELARENDLVVITGKGCEQAMVVKDNKKIPWDDRVVAREELKKLLNL